MKTIGIIGAMDEEVALLKEKMQTFKIEKKAGMEFYQGLLGEKRAVVVRSGIGKVNAAICTQILADDFHVDAVLNTGIAGSLKNEINIGDIVVSSDALQHDVDAVNFGYALGQIPRMDTFSFPADARLIALAKDACRIVNPDIGVFEGRVVTGDQFISDTGKKNFIRDTFGGLCTEMEGAAIAQAAHLNEIPFVIIRAISDKADNSATMDYPEFEAGAIRHCVNLVLEMLKMY